MITATPYQNRPVASSNSNAHTLLGLFDATSLVALVVLVAARKGKRLEGCEERTWSWNDPHTNATQPPYSYPLENNGWKTILSFLQ